MFSMYNMIVWLDREEEIEILDTSLSDTILDKNLSNNIISNKEEFILS